MKFGKGQANPNDPRQDSAAPPARAAESGTRRRELSAERQYSKIEPFVELRLRRRGRSVSRVITVRTQEVRSWFSPWGAELDAVVNEATALSEIFEIYFALG